MNAAKKRLVGRLQRALADGRPRGDVLEAAAIRGIPFEGVEPHEVRMVSTKFRKDRRRAHGVERMSARMLCDLAACSTAEARERLAELRDPPARSKSEADKPWVPKFGSRPVLRNGRAVRIPCRRKSDRYLPGWRPGW